MVPGAPRTSAHGRSAPHRHGRPGAHGPARRAASCTAGGWSSGRRGRARDAGATREEAGHERVERGATRSGRGHRRRPQGRRPRGRCLRAPPPAEKAAAKDAYLSEFLAERGKRDRQSQAWELLLTRSYDEPPSWKQIFDDLDPSVHAELGDPLRRPAGRRPGGVRAPLRGPLRRLTRPPASADDPSRHHPRPPRRGALPAAVADRWRRHGHGLAGPRRAARPPGRDQAGAHRRPGSAPRRPTSSGSGRCARAGSPPG